MIKVKDIIIAGKLGSPENVRLQQMIGKRLTAKGYRPVVRRVGGKAQRMWVSESEIALPTELAIDEAIGYIVKENVNA
jgi:hypothetical protein